MNNWVKGILVLGLVIILIPKSAFANEKPDLIIEGILEDEIGHRILPIYVYYCQVKNIGNRSINETIKILVQVNRLLFGFYPILLGRIYQGNIKKELAPGETIDIEFTYGSFFPSYFAWFFGGTYLLRAKVNPNHTIIESDYSNNNYCERFLPGIGP